MTNQHHTSSYECLASESGYVVLPTRCNLLLSGKDCGKFLNNFCTADIAKLADGHVVELFILDTRGKTLAFGHVAARGDDLLITTAAGDQSTELQQHLDKYVIREDVSFADQTAETTSFFLAGDSTAEKLPALASIATNQISSSNINGIECFFAHIELAGFGFLVNCARGDEEPFLEHLASLGIRQCALSALHSLRIEQGTPWYGIEIDESNLPQEMRRDEKAISFTKGCYLGQETVAKIDAFGHVNKFLVGIELESEDVPASGTEIQHDGKKIGLVKFVEYSPKLKRNLATGFVKCKLAAIGTMVSVGNGDGKIDSLHV